ncbi:30S ribosomal protein S21 [Candidatus Falkowbacteria bacterium]|jgi:ribosomal protein S21|nr:30S ribosomal protein S21 [Candidatus Falkowbacteria bacterium]MBT7007710.1 30S ribosomal protein S21 [Candidatus Falkowbacteria bacterium]
MLEAKRKKGESFESFLRRFNKRLIQSGVIFEFKSKRYHAKDESRNLQKTVAVARKKYKDKIQFLKKIGKLPEDRFKGKRRGGR